MRKFLLALVVIGACVAVGASAQTVSLLSTTGNTTTSSFSFDVTTAFANGSSQSGLLALGIYLDNDNSPINADEGTFTYTPSGGSATSINLVGQDTRMALGYFNVQDATTYTISLNISSNFTATPMSFIVHQVESDAPALALNESAIAYDPGNPAAMPLSTAITTDGQRGIVGYGFNDRGSQVDTNLTVFVKDFEGDIQFVSSLGASISDASAGTYTFNADWNSTNERRVGSGIMAFEAIPEPASLALVGLGALVLGLIRRKR